MPEPSRPTPSRPNRRSMIALALGVGLALLTGFGGVLAVLGGWLAQPVLALALRWWRGEAREDAKKTLDTVALRQDLLALGLLWGGTLLATAALVVWPLTALRESGSLGAVLGLSAVVGLGVVGLWRTWPLWRAVEREGGSLAQRWHQFGESDASGWQGVAAAACVAVVLTLVLVLAWPDLLPQGARWGLAVLAAIAWPLLHGALQRFAAPAALSLPVIEMPGVIAAAAPEIDGDPTTLLFDAARRGRVDRALELLDAGADAFALPPTDERDQRNLPVLAAVLPDLRLLRGLIAQGVDLNAAHAGMTPLLAATRDSWHGRPEAVMTLLANGADPRARDADGNTPLHHAARSSDPGVAALLRDAAAEMTALNNDGLTPLGVACAAGNWRLARFLLERGAYPEPEDATPALLAASGGDEDDCAGVTLLLKNKAKVNVRSRDGRSALHEAAFAGHAEIAAALIDAGADVQARDAAGRTPLLEAARGGRLSTFEALVAARADIHALDNEQHDALQLASRAEIVSSSLVRRLLELGADATRTDADGKRAIDHAASAGRWTLVAVLDPDYPLPSAVAAEAGDELLTGRSPPDRAPLSLLRDALREQRFEGHERLLSLLSPTELGGLLVDAEAPLSIPRIEWLLAQGADPEARDAHGDTPAFTLLAQGPAAVPALQVLLRAGASPAGSGGLARFLDACAAGDQAGRGLEQFALELLERGADPHTVSKTGSPPLSLAVRLGWSRLLERLVAHGVDLDARDAHGMTALHLCAALAREPALKILISHGASPDMRAADGQTPLGVALSGGHRELSDWLDWRGWPLPKRALRDTDLPSAAIVGDADAVRRLLDLGFAVDTPDVQGCTALLRAAGGGHGAVVDLLLARGADPRQAAKTGATPLSAAVSMRQGEIVERLIKAGAQLEQRLPGEVTVLMLAAAFGLPDLCARLLTHGADIHAVDAQGLTPLHCAALYGFTARDRPRLLALFDTLLLAGAEPDAAAAGGVTPLLLLLGARAEPGTACDEDVVMSALDHLLDEEVLLDAQDPRGFGPLHLAALHGLLRVTQRLLRAGCNPDLRDALNRPPREIAVMRGFVDVAAQFAPMQTGVSMARFLRDQAG
ncbi:ankyrin repeat domain-containing protein [Luteimonas panaciterrae]|uniref:ankyrin repeat domain-containing protein n=1 Tax=Luteimonas panaciterrae TaxID=363885 RepID=UPI001CFAE513|nr:ankyrin repeat domain-containing protein [Luteimonas panaciterrae]